MNELNSNEEKLCETYARNRAEAAMGKPLVAADVKDAFLEGCKFYKQQHQHFYGAIKDHVERVSREFLKEIEQAADLKERIYRVESEKRELRTEVKRLEKALLDKAVLNSRKRVKK